MLYTYRLTRTDPPAAGHAAIGWCLDEVPDPYDSLSFDNPDCPKTIDIGSILGLSPATELAAHRYNGDLISKVNVHNQLATFDEAPFLMTWGDDKDGEKIPDVSDDCPEVYNPDQRDEEPVFPLGGGYVEVPDGRGNSCHGRAPRRNEMRMAPRRNGIPDGD